MMIGFVLAMAVATDSIASCQEKAKQHHGACLAKGKKLRSSERDAWNKTCDSAYSTELGGCPPEATAAKAHPQGGGKRQHARK
ncbi:MAG TPA: hypothetical protein VKA21_16550 [Candidatus Binatia bacterium]|nr:hypothetical protein [Candidatus Binatia bacterium]